MTFHRMGANVKLTAGEAGPVRPGLRLAIVTRRVLWISSQTVKS
jgi:hypothetical protein